jgi:hypothetical protein
MKLLLDLELIPSTSWFSNVRSAVSRKEWDKIRKQVYDQAYHVCQICGDVGPNHPVECHEIWEFDDKKLTQTLTGMIALCPNCHLVKHIGFATVSGKRCVAMNHFIAINKLKRKDAEKIVQKAFELWAERSQKRYKIDISLLESYGIDTHKINK